MFLKISTINSDQGLPNEQVHATRQDNHGRIWMATPAGLACYNGNTIKVFDTRTGLECLGLRTIHITDEGIVWIGTDRGLEAIHVDGSKIELQFNFEWKYGIAESIIKTDDVLFVGTSFGLLKLKQTNNILALVFADDLGLVKQMLVSGKDQLLVVSAKYGLITYHGIDWRIVHSNLPESDLITCVNKTIDNFFLVGTFDGLFVLNSEFEIVNHYFLPEVNKKITAIAILGDEWWLAFSHTLVLVKPTITGIELVEFEDLQSIINDIFIDNTNNIWIASNNAGLKKISILRKTIQHIDCGINNSAFSIQEINQKRNLLVGGDGFCSIISIDDISQKKAPIILSALPSIVWDTCIDPIDKSKVWLATVDGLYYTISGATPERFIDINNIINSPNRVLIARDNEIWLGTIGGLFIIKNEEAIEILNEHGNKFGYVYSLTLDINKKILIGTLGQGLWRETENGIQHIYTDLLTEKGNTYSVVPNNIGDILVIQEERILLLDKNFNSRLVAVEHPIAGWAAVWLNTHTIATGSNDGIIIIDTNTGVVQQRINLLLSKADWQFTSTRALLLGGNDTLFCCLNSGLYSVDYKNIQHYNITPKVQLDEIVWENVSPQKNGLEFKIPTGKWSLNISVFAAWFTDEKQVRFRFKLIGFNETWIEITDRPSIRYSSLPQGKYELHCQAYTPFTGFGEIETILLLDVFSPWSNFGIGSFMSKVSMRYDKIFKDKHRNRLLLAKNEDLQKEIRDRQIAEQSLNNYKEQLEEIVANRTHELKYQKERAESADRMKSAFISNMSHEIRTPLGIVIGLNNLLQKTNPNVIQKDYITKIDSSAHHLLQVINDILDIAKIESGKVEIDNLPFSMNDIIKDFESFATLQLGEKYVGFFIENEITTTNLLIGDALKIKQVLLNLLSNAFKFTKKGKIKLTIKQIKTSVDKASIYFSISDTGIGMTGAQLEKVFEAFEQGDSSISRKYGGTGLGLNICNKFVSLMGGELKVNSEINSGTTFYFTLPLGISKELDTYSENKSNSNSYPINYPIGFDAIRGKKILIAEDDILNQFIIKEILESEGFYVIMANNGKECIEIFEKEKDIDLILMDIQMPEMDGFATTNYIRSAIKNNHIKIIGVSANAFSETKEQILSSGMNDFISKPIQASNLFSQMVKWINPKL
jgi:signal transduction histidine kinase/ligand-binding sensor domain-containing protein